MPKCRVCSSQLDVSVNWYPSHARLENRICKTCANTAHAKRYPSKKPRVKRPEGSWRDHNRERVRGYYRDWAAKNPDKILEIASRKRARKRLAIAPGYNAEAVQAKYALARRLSELFREPWHVDHIVPLARGGAHHQDNLQVIPAKVNILKSDQTELWYPDEYLIAVIGCRNPRLA